MLLLRGEAILEVIDGFLEPFGLPRPQFPLLLEFFGQGYDPALLPGQRVPHHPELDHHLGRERGGGPTDLFDRFRRGGLLLPGPDLLGDLVGGESPPGEIREFPDDLCRLLREEPDRPDRPVGEKTVVGLDERPDILLREPGEIRDIADLQFLLMHAAILRARPRPGAGTLRNSLSSSGIGTCRITFFPAGAPVLVS